MNVSMGSDESKELALDENNESAPGMLMGFIAGNKKVMAFVVLSAFSLIGGLWSAGRAVYKSGKGAAQYSTKDEVRTMIKESDSKNAVARKKVASDAKEDRVKLFKETKASHEKAMMLQTNAYRETLKRLQSMEIKGARVDERTKIMNVNILRIMKHMQVKKQN